MATLLLVRHGRTTANATGVLAGRTPGVRLDDEGRKQADALAARLDRLPLVAVVTSPLERCRETAEAVAGMRLKPVEDERLAEVKYGDWQGRELTHLAKEPLWKVVQQHPSAVTFPGEGGEAMLAVSERGVAAVREWDARIEAEHGPDAIWVAVSHGDVIKAILADALGMHLDQFQRILVDPCSVSVVRYTPMRPFVMRTNDVGGDLTSLVPTKKRRRRARTARGAEADSEAAIGGGAGGAPAAATRRTGRGKKA
jgi:probable phosphomutase (TIGR03848 family)